MRFSSSILAASWALSLTLWASDKPLDVKAGEAIPSKIIYTDHLGPFKHDLPAVLPMVVVSFQTQATEKGNSAMGIFSSGTKEYTLDGISPVLMQKITDQVQEALEAELKAGGWQIVPAEKAIELDAYKSWAKSPDPSGEEVKRAFFSKGKGTNTLSSKEMERVFVGGKRALVGNGVVLGGWAGAPAICKLGLALNAKVILFRALVNFANIEGGKKGIFTGRQSWKSSTILEVSYAELDVYPPDASGSTPARLHTEVPVTMFSDFITDDKHEGSHHTLTADPERYEKDTVEVLRAVAKGFVAVSNR